jgi:hypothetical protein
MEAIGDITASAEVSRVEVEGEEFDSRIQGGVLGDGIGMSPNASYHLSTDALGRWFAQWSNDESSPIHLCAEQWCCTSPTDASNLSA